MRHRLAPHLLLAGLVAGSALLLTPAAPAAPAAPATAAPAAATAPLAAAPAASSLFEDLARQAPALPPAALSAALSALQCSAREAGAANSTLTVIDYSLPSTEKRLWIFDLDRRELLFEELVAHGKNTGGNVATSFSNVNGSLQTSLGLFRTADTYYGKNGYSLRLHGLEAGINDLALERLIVIHGAPYVSEAFIRHQGRLGRSWGCPALTQEAARPVIDRIKGGGLVFAYHPEWEGTTALRGTCGAARPGDVVAAR